MAQHDTIELQDLRFLAHIGVEDEERAHRQELRLSLWLETDFAAASSTDNIEDAIDYVKLYAELETFFADTKTRLLETMACKLAEKVLARPNAKAVRLKLTKTTVLGGKMSPCVEIFRC